MTRPSPGRTTAVAITLLSTLPLAAQTGSLTRSDSLDLLHTRIELDLRETGSQLIHGSAHIRFVPRVEGITTLPLDLLDLTVDSVRQTGGDPLNFMHTGEELLVDLGVAHGPADTLEVVIHYGGNPTVDASGWGGFYTTSAYQYNLGVAFDAVPHSYGRAWFPCFDNFVERCTFEFQVRVNGGRTVFANGTLIADVDEGDGQRLFHWRIEEPIPSYLASVSATNYVAVRDTFPSISGALVPVALAAKPNDTTDLKNSFEHLHDAFDTFERWFGPYRWERVGYCLTTQGAMEHPTNISYPGSIADGTLQYEDVMAHELAHHWFGDLITCRHAGEMYINEGYAEFLSYLFLEDVYGRDRYMRTVRNNHHDMVSTAHLQDEGWWALNNVPQEHTYGEHSYRKGADLAHTLRGYMGDSLFASGYTRVLTNNAYSDMGTEELRDSLSVATGTDLTDYFADWIMQPGWAAFEVDSFTTAQDGGAWPTTLYVQQKLRHADHFYHNVPVTITFEGADGTRWTDPERTILGNEHSTAVSTPPFQPVAAFLNAEQLLALATTITEDTVTNTGTKNLLLADVSLITSVLPSAAPMRVEEFWTAADATGEGSGSVASPDRWWRITGRPAQGTAMDLRLTLDGRPTSGTCFDPGLVADIGGSGFQEDSLLMLYRPNAHFPWSIHADTEINTIGSDASDGYARLTAHGMTPGDWCIGLRQNATGVATSGDALRGWKLYPNPASEHLVMEAPRAVRGLDARIIVRDTLGRTLIDRPASANITRLNITGIAAQSVFVSARIQGIGEVMLGQVNITR